MARRLAKPHWWPGVTPCSRRCEDGATLRHTCSCFHRAAGTLLLSAGGSPAAHPGERAKPLRGDVAGPACTTGRGTVWTHGVQGYPLGLSFQAK